MNMLFVELAITAIILPCKDEIATVKNTAEGVGNITASERQLLLLLPDQVWEALHRVNL